MLSLLYPPLHPMTNMCIPTPECKKGIEMAGLLEICILSVHCANSSGIQMESQPLDICQGRMVLLNQTNRVTPFRTTSAIW